MPIPFNRMRALEQMANDEFEVLVVGGGITGCGVALDAAARGLRTALVEAADFGSGTSSRSSKLVHGGLRYLQQHDYRLVYEALHERQRLIDNAPHLVHPLPFLIPLFGRNGVVAKSVGHAYSLALWTYDLTGGIRIGRRHRRIDAGEALAHCPTLRTDRLATSFLYYDAQADDARLTLAVARTAASRGAVLANYSPVAELVEDGGRARGVVLADGTRIQAEVVVNATGVWSERVASLETTGDRVKIRPAKGVHLCVPAERLPCDFASVLAVPGDRRSIFVVPWEAHVGGTSRRARRFTYIGTTDTDYDGPFEEPLCTRGDVEYLLGAVNAWTTADLTPDDVTGSWAGLRPLISGARSARTADLSRRHRVTTSPSGLVSVTGGKLTTYRRMAADTVDAAIAVRGGRRGVGPSTTKNMRLVGALAGEQSTDSLAVRYGAEAVAVRALCQEDPSWSDPISPSFDYIKAEVVFAARHEMAQNLDDVLTRRTRARVLDREAALAAAPQVATLLAAELGWDAERQGGELAAFKKAVETDRLALGATGHRAGIGS